VGWVRLVLPGAAVLFTDRYGGASAPPFASANLGPFVGDDPAAVAENRGRALRALAGPGPGSDLDHRSLVWVGARPVHGAEVLAVDAATVAVHRAGPADDALPTVDGFVSAEPGAALAMLGGDCAPIALVAPHAVGAVHAGWPGLAGGVVPAAVEALTALAPAGGGDPEAIVALIGPTIRACCYEFGTADLAAVESRVGTTLRRATRDGRPALDLVGGLRHQLAAAGVGRVLDLGVCTACSPDHFSHRRDGRSGTGRQAVVVARRPAAA